MSWSEALRRAASALQMIVLLYVGGFLVIAVGGGIAALGFEVIGRLLGTLVGFLGVLVVVAGVLIIWIGGIATVLKLITDSVISEVKEDVVPELEANIASMIGSSEARSGSSRRDETDADGDGDDADAGGGTAISNRG